MRYKNDPYWTTAKYKSVCKKCNEVIYTDNKIFYYPLKREVFCVNCGEVYSNDFNACSFDEMQYCGY